MNRRQFLGGVTSVSLAMVAGCAEAPAIGASVREQLTGKVSKPRTVSIRNEATEEHTVTITVKDNSGSVKFNETVKVSADSSKENIWQTTQVGHYTVTAETETGMTHSAPMLVCVGYGDTWVVIYPDSVEVGQSHGDPTAAHCSIKSNG